MNKKKVLSAIICLSLILNVVLGILLYRQSTRYDFLKQQADQTFQAHFSLLTSHLTTACPEDESEYTMWVQKVEFLSNQCLDTFNLSSYEENHTLQDIILLLRSIALTWEEYPVGLIPHELATELMELSYRLTDDEELLTKVYEALDQLWDEHRS